LDFPEDFVQGLNPDPGVGVFLGGFVGQLAVAERQEESAAVHGQHHLLQAVGVAIRGGWGGFRGVLGDVAGSQGGVLDEADIHDVAIAGRDVPLATKVLLVEVGGVEE